MNGALVGCGTIAIGHLAAYQQMQRLTIKAIIDPLAERREQVTARYPSIRAYKTIDELMINEVLDFIDICSPPHTHLDYIRTGLANNCHVLCEKPLLLSVQDYKNISLLIKKTNRILYPCHNYKFAPIIQLMKNTVHKNNFGQIIGGHFRTLRSKHAVGVPEWKPHWRRDLTISGGGILRDHGTHSIYIASNICRQAPKSVSCLMGNLRKDGYHDTEDTVLMTLHFGEGVRFIIDLSWASSVRNSYYAILGTAENVFVENDEFCHKTINGDLIRQTLVSDFDDPSHSAWFINMFSDFIDSIATPSRQLSLLQEALTTSLVIESAYKSGKQDGVWFDVPYPSEEFL